MTKCKRCGRILKNSTSIKIGYGKTCARIVKLQQVNKHEMSSEIAFLRCEIATLKRMFKQIQANGTVEPIERIRQNRPEQKISGNEANFGSVIIEMKKKFLEIDSVYELLTPVDGRAFIEAPPVILA